MVLVREKNIAEERDNVAPLVRRLFVLQKRIMMLMSATALERFEDFIETYPAITKRVPNG